MGKEPRAPEVVRPHKTGAKYGISADIFSFGLLLFELRTLEKLVDDEENIWRDVKRKINNPLLEGRDTLKKLITKCLALNPMKRIKAEKVCQKTERES